LARINPLSRPSFPAVEPDGKADQDRREGRQPRPLCRVPDGGGRDPKKPLRRYSAVDRGTASTAGHVNSVRRSVSRVRQKPQETCALTTENSPLIGPRRGADNRPNAPAADGDASGLKNVAAGGNPHLPCPPSGECRLKPNMVEAARALSTDAPRGTMAEQLAEISERVRSFGGLQQLPG